MAQFTYNSNELGWIIDQMRDYVKECIWNEDNDSIQGYFQEIVKTGLFHDACGKVIGVKDDSIIVTSEY